MCDFWQQRSSGPYGRRPQVQRRRWKNERWLRTISLGIPVDPDEQSTKAGSSGATAVSARANGVEPPSSDQKTGPSYSDPIGVAAPSITPSKREKSRISRRRDSGYDGGNGTTAAPASRIASVAATGCVELST